MKKTDQIDGWFNHSNEFDMLVASVPDNGIFVECGAWQGKSSSYLCDIAKDRIQIFIVDHWQGSKDELDGAHKIAKEKDIYAIFIENMGNRKFTPLKLESSAASEHFKDNSCDVVFIDMGHTYEEVKRDIEIWLPKIKIGGIIAGHDYGWEGVNKAVHEKFNNIQTSGACWIVKC